MADGVQFELEAIITDLEPNNAYWIAIGISKDIWMVTFPYQFLYMYILYNIILLIFIYYF